MAHRLATSLRALMQSIPGQPHSPTHLAKLFDMNRVMVSRFLSALAATDPLELLHKLPGPESLRSITLGAMRLEIPGEVIAAANAAIDELERVIREEFGNRGALNAAISGDSSVLRRQVEMASRYQVFKGLSEIRGMSAETWFSSSIFFPSSKHDDVIESTMIQGALGIRLLRPDSKFYFSSGYSPHGFPNLELSRHENMNLGEFLEHPHAHVETIDGGNHLQHVVSPDRIGKDCLFDTIYVSHAAKASRRYATPERKRGGVSTFPNIPAKTLILDMFLHKDVFTGNMPELLVYNIAVRGPAMPFDPTRRLDLMATTEQIEAPGNSPSRLAVPEIPNYAKIVHRVASGWHHDLDEFSLYRLRVTYPVMGFQFVMAFEVPEPPTGTS